MSLTLRRKALLTMTEPLGANADYAHRNQRCTARTAHPADVPRWRLADFPELHANEPMRLRGEHIQPGAHLIVDGRPRPRHSAMRNRLVA